MKYEGIIRINGIDIEVKDGKARVLRKESLLQPIRDCRGDILYHKAEIPNIIGMNFILEGCWLTYFRCLEKGDHERAYYELGEWYRWLHHFGLKAASYESLLEVEN
jgi:hypothetical protein